MKGSAVFESVLTILALPGAILIGRALYRHLAPPPLVTVSAVAAMRAPSAADWLTAWGPPPARAVQTSTPIMAWDWIVARVEESIEDLTRP